MTKYRVPEWVKNLLLVLLSLSALWLVTRSPLYVDSPLETWVEQLFSPRETPAQTTVSLTAAARPLAISIVNPDGRYTAQYDADSVDAAFDALAVLLGESLLTAETPFGISELRWQTALSEPGIFWDFGVPLPLAVLSDWLGGESSGTSLTVQARRIALSPGTDGEEIWLFWQDASTGLFYACRTSVGYSQLLSKVSGWLPNSSFFAFQDSAYTACAPYTLISEPPQPAVYTAANSLSVSNSAAVEQVLDALSYSTAYGSSYTISGGTRYTDGINTFQLTDSGELTYHASDPAHYFSISTSHETPTVTECIEATRKLTQATLGQFCGSARLSLSSVEQVENSLILTYQYWLDGIPVLLRQEGWAAQFIITDGAISALTLHFRSYSPTEETALILPVLQTSAAMSALDAAGRELSLIYPDSGASSISAGWFTR